MGVQLNIKDETTVRLARELAQRRGITVTAVIRKALEREYDDQEQSIRDKVRAVNDLVAEFQRTMPAEWKGRSSKEIMDAIYDDEQDDGFAR